MRDHTTIISACASIAERKGYEADLATDLAEIARVLQEAMAKRAAPPVASEAV